MMQHTRLFVAIPINRDIIEIFYKFKIKNQTNEGIRWLPDKNLHITTCFIGNVENYKINNIVFQLEKFLLNIVEFKLYFDSFQLSPINLSLT
ncbi:MAG: hypothetical protein KAG95_06350 [Bacteroidales bacterium]|nr:hypothetical protein [Bacteroidales bacterium]